MKRPARVGNPVEYGVGKGGEAMSNVGDYAGFSPDRVAVEDS
jgi:hypothetical protein